MNSTDKLHIFMVKSEETHDWPNTSFEKYKLSDRN